MAQSNIVWLTLILLIEQLLSKLAVRGYFPCSHEMYHTVVVPASSSYILADGPLQGFLA